MKWKWPWLMHWNIILIIMSFVSWCSAILERTPSASQLTLFVPNCKISQTSSVHKKIYDEVKKIHDSFTTCENLLMLLHPFDSQKNEALNCAFTKHAPKHLIFKSIHSIWSSFIWNNHWLIGIQRVPQASTCRHIQKIKTVSSNVLLDGQRERMLSKVTSLKDSDWRKKEPGKLQRRK